MSEIKEEDRLSFVYAINSEEFPGRVKIGYTTILPQYYETAGGFTWPEYKMSIEGKWLGEPEECTRRLYELQLYSPVELQLLWSDYGGREEEQRLHRYFKSRRLWGEWFDFSDLAESTSSLSGCGEPLTLRQVIEYSYWRLDAHYRGVNPLYFRKHIAIEMGLLYDPETDTVRHCKDYEEFELLMQEATQWS